MDKIIVDNLIYFELLKYKQENSVHKKSDLLIK